MQEAGTLSELDLQIVHALQLQPRASWAALGAVLEVTASTLARRWQDLKDARLAWVTATPSANFVTAGCIAYVGVICDPERKQDIVSELSLDPAIAAVEITTGRFDLLLSLAMADLPTLASFLLERVDRIPGVRSTDAVLATHGYTEGSRWRLRALSRTQAAAMTPTAAAPTASAPTLPKLDGLDRLLLQALGNDGRMSHAAIASRTGTSSATVRRRMNRLIASGAVGIRCDVAAPLFGWPIAAYLRARVTPLELADVASGVARLASVRLAATVTGTANLFIAVWLRSIDGLPELEAGLSGRFPSLDVVERAVSLKSVKRAGQLLDQQGRTIGAVPMMYPADQ